MAPLSFVLSVATLAGLVRPLEACGGNYTTLSGVIQSPNFPANYTNNLDCVYTITAPSTHRVTLTFLDLDVERGPLCVFDYVEVRDGGSETSPQLGRFCGTTLSETRRTFGHQMWIKFVTDGSTTGTGFRVNYTSGIHQNNFFLIAASASGGLNGKIMRMDIETRSNYRIPMSGPLLSPIAVDYDPVDSTIYWTEVGVVSRVRASALNGSGVHTVWDAGPDGTLDGLAVDSLSRLIFYSDAGNDVICMIAMSTFAHRTIIDTNLGNPRAIVLDTTGGVLFWTDWGGKASALGSKEVTPKIERANYDGSNRRTLVSSYLHFVNALALDVPNDFLYWAEAGSNIIGRTDMDGNERTVLFRPRSSPHHFFGLTVFQDMLYITDWRTRTVGSTSLLLRLTATSGGNATVFGSASSIRMNDIHTYSPLLYQTGSNGCGSNKGGCGVFCIPLPHNASKCLCPDGESLMPDFKSCGLSPTTTSTNIPTRTAALSVSVSTSPSLPFDTNGKRELSLTCDLNRSMADTVSYIWNLACSRQSGNTCVFSPQPEKDDGKEITCTVTSAEGSGVTGGLTLDLNYPPSESPTINGYTEDQTLQAGHSLTMICSVPGGQPLVSAVIFSCEGHPDTSPDIVSPAEVHSLLTLNPLTLEDNGRSCVCTARWKNKKWYRLSDSVILSVHGSPKKPSTVPINLPAILGGSSGGGGAGIVVVIFIVCLIHRRRRNTAYERPRRRSSRAREENPYATIGAQEGGLLVANQAFNAGGSSGDYSYPDCSGLLKDVRLASGVSRQPVPAPRHPPPPVPCQERRPSTVDGSSCLYPRSTPPDQDYLHPKPAPQDLDYLHPTPAPQDLDYLHPKPNPQDLG